MSVRWIGRSGADVKGEPVDVQFALVTAEEAREILPERVRPNNESPVLLLRGVYKDGSTTEPYLVAMREGMTWMRMILPEWARKLVYTDKAGQMIMGLPE